MPEMTYGVGPAAEGGKNVGPNHSAVSRLGAYGRVYDKNGNLVFDPTVSLVALIDPEDIEPNITLAAVSLLNATSMFTPNSVLIGGNPDNTQNGFVHYEEITGWFKAVLDNSTSHAGAPGEEESSIIGPTEYLDKWVTPVTLRYKWFNADNEFEESTAENVQLVTLKMDADALGQGELVQDADLYILYGNYPDDLPTTGASWPPDAEFWILVGDYVIEFTEINAVG